MASDSLQDKGAQDSGSPPPTKASDIPDEPPAKWVCCGHQWHWCEVLFLCAIPVGVGCAAYEFSKHNDQDHPDGQPPLPFAIILLALSAIGMALIWNHATTKKLAETSATLRQTIRAENEAIVEAERQNRRLEENNRAVRERLDNLKKSVDILGGSVQNMAAIERKLNEIFVQQELSQEKRRQLNAEQTEFLRKQEEDTLEREKTSIKQRIKDQCEESDKDKDGTISAGPETERMKQFLKDYNIPWSDNLDKDGDGVIEIYEIMEYLDKVLDAHFEELRVKLAEKASLAKELYETNFQLAHLAKKAA